MDWLDCTGWTADWARPRMRCGYVIAIRSFNFQSLFSRIEVYWLGGYYIAIVFYLAIDLGMSMVLDRSCCALLYLYGNPVLPNTLKILTDGLRAAVAFLQIYTA